MSFDKAGRHHPTLSADTLVRQPSKESNERENLAHFLVLFSDEMTFDPYWLTLTLSRLRV